MPPHISEEIGSTIRNSLILTRSGTRKQRSTAPSPVSRSASPGSDMLSPSLSPLPDDMLPPSPIHGKRLNREPKTDSDSDEERTPKHSRAASPMITDAPSSKVPLFNPKTESVVDGSITSEGPPNDPHLASFEFRAQLPSRDNTPGSVAWSSSTVRNRSTAAPNPQPLDTSSIPDDITHVSSYTLSPTPETATKPQSENRTNGNGDREWTDVFISHEYHSKSRSPSPETIDNNPFFVLLRKTAEITLLNLGQDSVNKRIYDILGSLLFHIGDLFDSLLDDSIRLPPIEAQNNFKFAEGIRKSANDLSRRIHGVTELFASRSLRLNRPLEIVSNGNVDINHNSPLTITDLIHCINDNFMNVNARLDGIESRTKHIVDPDTTGGWGQNFEHTGFFDLPSRSPPRPMEEMSPDEAMRDTLMDHEAYSATTIPTLSNTPPTPAPKNKSILKPASEYPVPNRPPSGPTNLKPLSELPKPVAPQTDKGTKSSMHAPGAPLADSALVPNSQQQNASRRKGKVVFTPVPVTNVFATQPTYKPTMNSNKPADPIKVDGNKISKVLANNLNSDARFIINLKNVQTGVNAFAPERTIANLIRPTLQKAQRLKFRSVKWNRTGNLIFSFVHGAIFADFLRIVPDIKKALLIPETAQVYEDTPWSKVVVARVPTGLDDDGQGERFSNEDLLTELIACNPHVSSLNIVMQPRWITKSENMHKPESSFMFAFKDPDGSILPKFLKFNTCMFGKSTPTDTMRDQPLLKECDRCLALDHDKSSCRGAYRCNLCAGGHSTLNHNKKCKACIDTDVPLQDRCPHPLKCANCNGDHKASDPLCPKRSAFKKPLKKGRTAQIIRERLANPVDPNPASAPNDVPAPAVLDNSSMPIIEQVPVISTQPTQPDHTPHPSPTATELALADASQIIDETMDILTDPDSVFHVFDIFIFQDPWWGKIGTDVSAAADVYGTVSSPLFFCLHHGSSQSDKKPSVVTYVRKGKRWLDANISSHYPPHRDLLAIDFSIYGSHISIINGYFHGTNAKEGLHLLIDTPPQHTIPAIYAGDFNLHHELWALPDGVTPSQTGPADDLASWIITNDFNIMNSGMRTRRGRGRQKDSVIDLTITNGAAWDNDMLVDWDSSERLSLDSDHNGISWTIKIPNLVNYTPAPKLYQYSIDASREEDWIKSFNQAMISYEFSSNISDVDSCQRAALALLEAMSTATRETMPKTRVGNVAKRCPWWDDTCSLAVHNIVSYSQSDQYDQDTWIALKGELRRCIRAARRSHADRVTAEVSQCTDLWKLRNWSSGKRYNKMPPIRSNAGYATHPREQSQIFINSFFPAVPPEVDMTVADCIPRRESRDHHPITESKISEALASSSNTSAPGAFGSNYRALKWAFKTKPAIFITFFNSCLTLGFHPACLRNAIVSIIPKPRKIDMSNPSSYRPISLLETLSKCLEKIITSRILYDVGSLGLVPYSQFGSRDNSSCTDAGLSMVHDIHSFWQNHEKVSLLTLDIKGYFNNINHALLIYILSRLGFSSPTVNWLRSFFSDRTVQIRIDSFLSDPSPITSVGVPQGSPLSPILSALYSLPLLLHMEQARNIEIKGYVDDFTILAHSNSFTNNQDIIQASVQTASTILHRLGLSFEIEKCDLIHFASRASDMNVSLRVDLSPPGCYGKWISPQPCIRWLGYYLDRRLTWKPHIKKKCSQALAVVGSLGILANSTRGISVKHARLLFKTCVFPVLTYGSVIWYTGVGQKGLIKPLERAQNQLRKKPRL
ncbi:Reverse transcriptase from mobile element jockey protein [Ceratobasidium sp. AG-Ba]|nr:Reverse transcriptase from mobile element jockey protein [Ceratobasidium sp. AG-Ba]